MLKLSKQEVTTLMSCLLEVLQYTFDPKDVALMYKLEPHSDFKEKMPRIWETFINENPKQ